MGTMNFSIPDDVKDKFNEVFKDENKSAVIAELMRRAVEEFARTGSVPSDEQQQQRFEAALTRLEQARRMGRTYSDEEIRALREEGRH